MKEIWVCTWETIPGDGEHTEQFSSLEAANKAMRQKIIQNLDLGTYISLLRRAQNTGSKAADFLEKYLTDPEFPGSPGDVPVDYEEPDHCDLYLSASQIGWQYRCDACPQLHTNLVLEQNKQDEYEFHFWYDHPENLEGGQNTDLSIRMRKQTVWGTSAYPLMILRVLNTRPQTQEQIARAVYELYEVKIDRKAVGRHLKLLQELGFSVHHNRDGYYTD